MPRVYILNKGAHDYSPAERFGTLVYCTEGSLNKFNINQMFRELSDAMKDSTPQDFIMLTALSSLCGVACGLFATKYGRINLLLFRDGAYISRTVVFNK